MRKRDCAITLLIYILLLSTLHLQAQVHEITSLSDINPTGDNLITADIDASGFSTIATFSGTLEAAIDPTTNMPYRITNLRVPLFTTLTGTVKNLVLEDVNITSLNGQIARVQLSSVSLMEAVLHSLHVAMYVWLLLIQDFVLNGVN